MKELVKPNTIEEQYEKIHLYNECTSNDCCYQYCKVCNRYCTTGSENQSPLEEIDILF